jgi:hypothetical protein
LQSKEQQVFPPQKENLPILCAWQDSAKHTKLAAIDDFGRRNDGTRGKHPETKKMAAIHVFGRTLPILYLWQDFVKFVNLAAQIWQ